MKLPTSGKEVLTAMLDHYKKVGAKGWTKGHAYKTDKAGRMKACCLSGCAALVTGISIYADSGVNGQQFSKLAKLREKAAARFVKYVGKEFIDFNDSRNRTFKQIKNALAAAIVGTPYNTRRAA